MTLVRLAQAPVQEGCNGFLDPGQTFFSNCKSSVTLSFVRPFLVYSAFISMVFFVGSCILHLLQYSNMLRYSNEYSIYYSNVYSIYYSNEYSIYYSNEYSIHYSKQYYIITQMSILHYSNEYSTLLKVVLYNYSNQYSTLLK